MKRTRKTRGLTWLRSQLLQRKEQLLDEVSSGINESRSHGAETHSPDIPDQAVQARESDVLFRLMEMESAELRAIDEALRKMGKGEYGTCERCGGSISSERLRFLPFASLCVRCKKEEEQEFEFAGDDADNWSRVADYSLDDEGPADLAIERGRKVT